MPPTSTTSRPAAGPPRTASSAAGRGSAAPRGAAGRVAATHRQTRRGLLVTAAFLLAAPVAAVVPHSTGPWLPLHLFLVGALLSAVSAVTQMLAVTWSSAPAPPERLAAAQRWLLASGAALLAAGRELGWAPVAGVGGTLVVAALVLLALLLVRIRASAAVDRYRPAIDAYLVAVAAGVVGCALGVLLAIGRGPTGSDVLSAHLTVNVYGLVGLVIAGTLPAFAATQARTKVSPRATPARLRGVVGALAAATAVAATGLLVGHDGVAAVGLASYVVGLVALLALVPRLGRRQLTWAGPRLVQLLAGMGWWMVATLLLARSVAAGDGLPGPLLRTLAIGGFAQVLVASLAYLGPVVRGGGHQRLTAGFAATRSWPSLVAGNVAAWAALADLRPLLVVTVAAWGVDVARRAGALVAARRGDDGSGPVGSGPAPDREE